MAVRLLHIHQYNPSACQVADELYAAGVLAAAVPAVVVLLLGKLPNRLAAELLERPAHMAHVEEQIRRRGELGRRVDAHPGEAVREANAPQAGLAVRAYLARCLVEQIDRAGVHADQPQISVDEAETLAERLQTGAAPR